MGKNWNGRKTAKFGLKAHLNAFKAQVPIVTSSKNYTPMIDSIFYWLGIGVISLTVLFYLWLFLFN
jgi:hypothetical protein